MIKGKPSFRKDKTYEELYGIDKANEMKKRASKRMSGKNHPFYEKKHKKESIEQMRKAHKGHKYRLGTHHSIETIEQMRKAHKGQSSPMEGKHHSELTKTKIGDSNRGKKRSMITKQKMRKFKINYYKEHPEEKYKLSKFRKKVMDEEPQKFKEWIKKIIKSSQQRPNKTERILIDLFKQLNLPYDYVGDGSKIIGTLNPDFIHSTEKKIIELFGVWHEKGNVRYTLTEEGRIEYFKKRGYQTLVIWCKDLKNNFPDTIQKIIEFNNAYLTEEVNH